ncbi:MAG: hypothetical protein QG597_824 [Actinomycetota bacterium]|nr:hypothetical protein [Actinomycetota bacterium]
MNGDSGLTPAASPARSGPGKSLAVLLALCGMAVALAAGWHGTLARYSGAGAREALCPDYYSLKYAVVNPALEAKATLRFRTARLARDAQFASDAPQRDADAPSGAATRLEWVLRQASASTDDIFTNARPVAVACGDPWRFLDPQTQR